MDHVDAQHNVGAGDWPTVRRCVERDRRPDVAQAECGGPGVDADARAGLWVARLENEVGTTGLGEVYDVLARAARDLKHEAARRQVAL